MQAVAKTVGKGYDRVSAAATKISNKIDDISAKSRQSISNMFGKATTKLGSKIDDIGLKARSLNLKHVEIPSLAMAGGGNAGRPIKVPVGVGINEKKLEKLRQMKVNPSGSGKLDDIKPKNVLTPIKSKPKVGEVIDGKETKVVVKGVVGDKVGYGVNQESAAFKNLGGEIEYKSPKRLKDEAKGFPVPNLTPETSHAELQVLESLNRAGELKGKDVTLYIEFSENMKMDQLQRGSKGYTGLCEYCASDVKYYAQKSGANSITVIDTEGNKLTWKPGYKKWR